ncbi:MAG: GNAT family N-acetyltransferase [Frankiaceae bacterium]|jgi:ribosomal-protein-alanine N-acetyltransferase|nr:GNAT family N-acetyltransferase [Frankiaceae bacterium]
MPAVPGWPAVLRAGPVTLRPPRRRDARAWSEQRMRNEQWLTQWEPTSALSWERRHSPGAWRPMVRALSRAATAGAACPFMIDYGGRLVGQISVSGVTHGVLRCASIGYWVDSAVAGRGIAPTALALAIDHCLSAVQLHRIEVAIRPENAASLRVAAKLGLRREGYFERYLDIGGAWRDHVIFAITVEELAGGSALSRLAALARPPG